MYFKCSNHWITSSVNIKVYIIGVGGGHFYCFVWTATNYDLIIDYIDIVVSNK